MTFLESSVGWETLSDELVSDRLWESRPPTKRAMFLLLALLFCVQQPQTVARTEARPANSSQQRPLPVTARKQALERYLQTLGVFGFSGGALVARGDEILFRGAVGMADREKGTPNTAETVFNTASLTKQFTGAAILKLEMQGKLRTTDSIVRFLPGVPADKRGITLHHLLTHSSGLGPTPGGGISPDRDAEIAGILSEPLAAPIGARHMYANTGYTLLAAIVEIASGTTYERYLRDNLWVPAGMQSTGITLVDWSGKRLARYYVGPADNGPPRTSVNWRNMGSGGVLTTLDDLHRWYRALRDNTVLSPDASRKLVTPGSAGYAYGWGIRRSPWGPEIEHDGGTSTGVGADMRFYPDSNVVVISFANDDGETTLLGAVRERLRSLAMGNADGLPPTLVKAEPATLRNLEGRYRLPSGAFITATASNGALALRPSGQSAMSLLWTGVDRPPGGWQSAATRSERMFVAAMKGDTAALRAMLPRRVRLPAIMSSWRAELMQRLGAFQRVEVLGTRPGPPGARDEAPTEVRLHFERGVQDAVLIWSEEDLAFFSRVPEQRAVVFVPAARGELVGYDFMSGEVRRLRVDGSALVIGGTRAAKQ